MLTAATLIYGGTRSGYCVCSQCAGVFYSAPIPSERPLKTQLKINRHLADYRLQICLPGPFTPEGDRKHGLYPSQVIVFSIFLLELFLSEYPFPPAFIILVAVFVYRAA